MSNHFNNGICEKFQVQILSQLPERPSRAAEKRDRLQLESHWIRKLCSKYPYGLNSNMLGENGNTSIYRNFILRDRTTRIRGKRKPRSQRFKIFNPEQFLYTQYNRYKTHPRLIRRYLFQTIMSTPINNVKKLHQYFVLTDFVADFTEFIKDLLETRLLPSNATDVPKKKRQNYLVIPYVNKAIDYFNLNRILKDKNLNSHWPSEIPIVRSKPSICFKYDTPISLALFNFKKVTSNLDMANFLLNPPSCYCHHSPFIDYHHGHVITSNLEFIENISLRRLMEKGTKYRIPKTLDFAAAEQKIDECFRTYLSNICKRFKIIAEKFNPWLSTLKQLVSDCTIKSIQNASLPHDARYKMPWKAIRDLQEHFVITSVDKSSNNYAIICKSFYIKLLCKEVGFDCTPVAAYQQVGDQKSDIIGRLTEESKANFGVEVSPEFAELPYIHLVPKFHKNPVKFRPIIASTKATTKPVSICLTKLLRLVMSKMKTYCNTISKSSGVNPYWIVENSKEVATALNQLSLKNKAKSVSTFDFTTLYTTLDHSEISLAIASLLNRAFGKDNNTKIIRIIYKKAFWSYLKSPTDTDVFSKEKILNMVTWLVGNTYFTIGNLVFIQKIGIPMGTNAAPLIANLLLHHFEIEYIIKNLKANYQACRKLNHIYRYIDDITAFNDDGTFGNAVKEIYPASLTLEAVNSDPKKAYVLDMDINIEDKKFEIDIYDKRTYFPFKSILYPDPSGNINLQLGYNIVSTEIIRYSNMCSSLNKFLVKTNMLLTVLINKGYCRNKLLNTASKTINKHKQIRQKYDFHGEIKQLLTAKT